MLIWMVLLACGEHLDDGFALDASGCKRGRDYAESVLEGRDLRYCDSGDSDIYINLRWPKLHNHGEESQLVTEADSRCYLIRYCELYEAECGPLDDPCDLIER